MENNNKKYYVHNGVSGTISKHPMTRKSNKQGVSKGFWYKIREVYYQITTKKHT